MILLPRRCNNNHSSVWLLWLPSLTPSVLSPSAHTSCTTSTTPISRVPDRGSFRPAGSRLRECRLYVSWPWVWMHFFHEGELRGGVALLRTVDASLADTLRVGLYRTSMVSPSRTETASGSHDLK